MPGFPPHATISLDEGQFLWWQESVSGGRLWGRRILFTRRGVTHWCETRADPCNPSSVISKSRVGTSPDKTTPELLQRLFLPGCLRKLIVFSDGGGMVCSVPRAPTTLEFPETPLYPTSPSVPRGFPSVLSDSIPPVTSPPEARSSSWSARGARDSWRRLWFFQNMVRWHSSALCCYLEGPSLSLDFRLPSLFTGGGRGDIRAPSGHSMYCGPPIIPCTLSAGVTGSHPV